MQENMGLNTLRDQNIYMPARHGEERERENTELEELKKEFEPAIKWRGGHYQEIVSQNSDEKAEVALKNQLTALNTHNDIVLEYAFELTKELDLTREEKVAVILGVIFHDSGKLGSEFLKHHLEGMKSAEKFFNGFGNNQKFNDIKITPKILQMVKDAINEHMPHPFIKDLIEKNNLLPVPEPKTMVAKAVFDADMLANIGFKNVANRLNDAKLLEIDAGVAKDGKFLAQTFRNVVKDSKFGADKLGEVVLTEPAKNRAQELIGDLKNIYDHLINSGVLDQLQNDYYGKDKDGNVSITGSVGELIKDLNDKIRETGRKFGVGEKVLDKFVM